MGVLASGNRTGAAEQLLLKYALRGNGNTTAAGPDIQSSHTGATAMLWTDERLMAAALRIIPLSRAFPLLSLQLALIPIACTLLLDERVSLVQCIRIASPWPALLWLDKAGYPEPHRD
jgi:hypothetical protein